MAKQKNLSAVYAEMERIARERREHAEQFLKYRDCDRCGARYGYRSKLSRYCQPCRLVLKTEKASERYQKLRATDEGRQSLKQQNERAYKVHREKILARAKARNRALKREVIHHYGGKCNCCGETTLDFLCIDHRGNDGAVHRRIIKASGGGNMYRWIKRNDFPSNLQVLCGNCNMAKSISGTCPHKLSEAA